MSEEIRGAIAGDGYLLKYRTWQAGPSDTLVVALHGLLTHSAWFTGLAEGLATRGVHTLGHDRRGSGLNLQERGDVDSAQRLLDDLGATVEPWREQYPTIVYLGWCLGSCVALEYLLQKPHMGEGLILMSPDVFERHITPAVRLAFDGPQWDDRTLPRLRVPLPVEAYTDTHFLDDFVRKDELKLKDFTPRLMSASMRLKRDLEARLSAFRKPSLLLLARRDQIIDNERTAALYRHVGSEHPQVATLDCNHGIMFEALPEMLDTVEGFARTAAA
ncbi:MAG TPA: alpha/beta fold hydrolase, partial [Vicinamibacteria bacterium]